MHPTTVNALYVQERNSVGECRRPLLFLQWNALDDVMRLVPFP